MIDADGHLGRWFDSHAVDRVIVRSDSYPYAADPRAIPVADVIAQLAGALSLLSEQQGT